MARTRRWFTEASLLAISGAAWSLMPKRSAQAQTSVTVTTAEALVREIGPNRVIELAPGSFTLSDVNPNFRTPYASFRSTFDGYELVVSGVENLTLVGTDNTLSRILTRPRYSDVLKFRDCRNLSLQNLELAHTQAAGFCRGSVLNFMKCRDVNIDRCVLFGSGTHGIEAHTLTDLSCRASVIRGCTSGVLCLDSSDRLNFETCQFIENTGFSMINLARCSQVIFDTCLIHDNATENFRAYDEASAPYWDDFMFDVWESRRVELVNCELYQNRVLFLAPADDSLTLTNTTLRENAFAETRWYPPEPFLHQRPFCPVDD